MCGLASRWRARRSVKYASSSDASALIAGPFLGASGVVASVSSVPRTAPFAPRTALLTNTTSAPAPPLATSKYLPSDVRCVPIAAVPRGSGTCLLLWPRGGQAACEGRPRVGAAVAAGIEVIHRSSLSFSHSERAGRQIRTTVGNSPA